MKAHPETTRYTPALPPRAGASLVEILMSLMVMSIGLVSVAALFPVSMLRSMQATQLTNAGLLYYQCEDYTRAFPQLLFNDINQAIYPNNPPGYPPHTLPNVEMRANSPMVRRYGITSTEQYVSSLPLKFVTVVDPLGAAFNPNLERRFGTDNFGLHAVEPFSYQAVRKNAGFDVNNPDPMIREAQLNLALSMFASPDSWSTTVTSNEVEGTGGANTLVLADISAGDLQTFAAAITSGIRGRAVVFDRHSRQSHVSRVSNVDSASRTITLATAVPTNPRYFQDPPGVWVIPEVRLELLEPRYTCLITTRRQLMNLGPAGTPGADGVDDDGSGDADSFSEVGWPGTDDEVRNLGANLVVFFRRDFSPFAEQVYEAGNLLKGLNELEEARPITIRWNGGNPDSKPRIRNGAWVFDPVNGYWYQIANVIFAERAAQNPVNANNTREAVVTLDRPPEATGNYLMVMERVVEVFDFTGF